MARQYSPRNFFANAILQSRDEIEHLNKHHLSSLILLILYFVGISCLILNIHPDFIYLTPINLLLSFIIVLWAHPKWNIQTGIAILFIFCFGLGIEIIGVATGDVFGTYEYGDVLGPKFMDTPYVIGLNWAMLVYCAAMTVNYLTDIPSKGFWPIVGKSLLGASLLLSLDILIEPVAIIQGFWSWGSDGIIPIQNYVAWFLISFLLLLLFNTLVRGSKNKVAFTLLVLQFLFFFLLGIDWF